MGVLTRKEVDKLTEFVRGIGAKGLAWVRWTEENIASSFGKFLTEEEMTRLLTAAGAEKGDVVLIVADTVKGYRVSFMEKQIKWHCGSLNDADLKTALSDLTEAYEREKEAI